MRRLHALSLGLEAPRLAAAEHKQDRLMIRKIIFAAGIALAPQLAAAQTVVTDPQLLAIARQQLTVMQQQLVVLNAIEALEQSKTTGPAAAAALAYAQQQGQKQAEVEQAQQQAQVAETPQQ